MPTLWTPLKVSSIDEAVEALKEREKVPNANLSIGRWPEAKRSYFCADRLAEFRRSSVILMAWRPLLPLGDIAPAIFNCLLRPAGAELVCVRSWARSGHSREATIGPMRTFAAVSVAVMQGVGEPTAGGT